MLFRSPNGHDDLANAVAGAAAATRSKYRYDSSLDWVAGPDYGKSTADAGFCQMMGGDITVASEPGKGSVFTVRLPG